jgi:hypothetical protein
MMVALGTSETMFSGKDATGTISLLSIIL